MKTKSKLIMFLMLFILIVLFIGQGRAEDKGAADKPPPPPVVVPVSASSYMGIVIANASHNGDAELMLVKEISKDSNQAIYAIADSVPEDQAKAYKEKEADCLAFFTSAKMSDQLALLSCPGGAIMVYKGEPVAGNGKLECPEPGGVFYAYFPGNSDDTALASFTVAKENYAGGATKLVATMERAQFNNKTTQCKILVTSAPTDKIDITIKDENGKLVAVENAIIIEDGVAEPEVLQGLPEGKYTVNLTSGSASQENVILVIDTTPPTLPEFELIPTNIILGSQASRAAAEEPQEVFTSGKLLINGSASDNLSSAITLELFLNSESVGQAVIGSGDSFQFEVTPALEGPNQVTLEAADEAGNEASQSLTLVFDPTAPVFSQLLIDGQNAGSIQPGDFISKNLEASGVVNDTTLATVTMEINDRLSGASQALAARIAGGDNNFSFTPVALAKGTYDITFIATDQLGNETRMALTDLVVAGFMIANPLPASSPATDASSSPMMEAQGVSSLMGAPTETRGTAFTCNLSEPAALKIRIYNTHGQLVKELTAEANVGFISIPWDLTDQRGEKVPNGAYIYTIFGQSEESQETAKAKGRLAVLR